jgi:hypothetical protein
MDNGNKQKYYDWTLTGEANTQCEGAELHHYYPRTGNLTYGQDVQRFDEDRTEAKKLLQSGATRSSNGTKFHVDRVQGHITRVFGENATLVGIKDSKPNLLEGMTCQDVRFDWVYKNHTQTLNSQHNE